MEWTGIHGKVLAEAVSQLIGHGTPGAMAFLRCLTPEAVRVLADDTESFNIPGWDVFRVADIIDEPTRTITADRAVEIRESKGHPTLLLVDTDTAGAGMDGVWSATRELSETQLFERASEVALKKLRPKQRKYVRQAVRRARERGAGVRVSPWQEFNFYCHAVRGRHSVGACLPRIGLWPVKSERVGAHQDASDLQESRRFVDRLLDARSIDPTTHQRIDALRLLNPSPTQLQDLTKFLLDAATLPVGEALQLLGKKEHLWVNALKTERVATDLLGIDLLPWRGKTGKLLKWSGLADRSEDVPQLILPRGDQVDHPTSRARTEVRWKARPGHLPKGAVDYRVEVLTVGTDTQLVAQELTHARKAQQKAIFTHEDFTDLPDDARIPARVRVSAIGSSSERDDSAEGRLGPHRAESEEFEIVFGEPEGPKAAVGRPYRTFSDAMIELDSREMVRAMTSLGKTRPAEAQRGFLIWRTPDGRRYFRVFRPSLIKDVEERWRHHSGAPGRWRIRVRLSGETVGAPEFVPLERPAEVDEALWGRARKASRRIVDLFADFGCVGQVYDSGSPRSRNVVTEYLRSWLALWRQGTPELALAQTVEVKSQSGDLVGLIVLPAHPLRMAWHIAYDNLALHAVFNEQGEPSAVRKELASLDGAAFPAFLPGIAPGHSFVFADTLGFHAVGMVAGGDPEPKGTLSILHRALTGEEDGQGAAAPTVGSGSADILGKEIRKYVESHSTARILHVHALRAGDGKTVVRALGRAADGTPVDGARRSGSVDTSRQERLVYVLEVHPSRKQLRSGVAGRFISEAQERRRRGAGTVERQDRWMLESQDRPGGIRVPHLRWARKDGVDPDSASHIALAFDTFTSEVLTAESGVVVRPFHVYGLMSFFNRAYRSRPRPRWEGVVPEWKGGERHPDAPAHSSRLQWLQAAIHKLVAANMRGGDGSTPPALVTELSMDATDGLDRLHALSDWVITLDRNAGLEYFDSPRDHRETYEKFVIDCVPEREDLGCLRLITSTANLDEIQDLLTDALEQMGLSHRPRSADFLMSHLKSVSGRLAIRLAGGRGPTSELVALAMSHAYCRQASDDRQAMKGAETELCWVSLRDGFLVPVDDIRDLLPRSVLPSSHEHAGNWSAKRPDLIYVRPLLPIGLSFQFVEVKYRRHLRAARSPQLVENIRRQTESLKDGWFDWYGAGMAIRSIRAIRLAKLARILHFYVAKANRHGLSHARYKAIAGNIDKMVEQSESFRLEPADDGNRGWVFCPEYRGADPMQISPEEWDEGIRVFLFGPACLPGIGKLQPVSIEPPREDIAIPLIGLESRVDQPASGRVASEPAERHAPGAVVTGNGASTEAEGQGGGKRDAPTLSEAEGGASATTSGGTPSPDPVPRIILGEDRFGASSQWHLTVKGNPHLLIAGLPGMGKTTCLLNLCKQMLAAGVQPIVFSYHEDIDERLELLRGWRPEPHSGGSAVQGVRFVDFDGLGFNPLEVLDRSWKSAHIDVAGVIRDIFMAIYPDLGPLQGAKIRTAVKQSFEELGWGSSAGDLGALQEPPFRRFLEIMRAEPKPAIGIKNLLARLDELDDYGFFGLGTPHGSLWESDRPTVIRIHRTKSNVLQNAFASLVVYGLYKNMFQRGIQDRITHAVIVDEAHRAARLNLIPTMAKECRKYGISLVLASQQATDFHTSVFSAIANYLVLRMTELDAKALVKNVATSAQQRSLVDQIKEMGRFKALYFSSHGARPKLLALPDFSPTTENAA